MRGVECGELVNTKMWESSLRGIRAGCHRNCWARGVSVVLFKVRRSNGGGNGNVYSVAELHKVKYLWE